MNSEPPAKHHRIFHPGWWLLALLVAAIGYGLWNHYDQRDYRAAVIEAQKAGFNWTTNEPFDVIGKIGLLCSGRTRGPSTNASSTW